MFLFLFIKVLIFHFSLDFIRLLDFFLLNMYLCLTLFQALGWTFPQLLEDWSKAIDLAMKIITLDFWLMIICMATRLSSCHWTVFYHNWAPFSPLPVTFKIQIITSLKPKITLNGRYKICPKEKYHPSHYFSSMLVCNTQSITPLCSILIHSNYWKV